MLCAIVNVNWIEGKAICEALKSLCRFLWSDRCLKPRCYLDVTELGNAIQSLKSFPSQVTYQPMEHIHSRPLQAPLCLQRAPLPISQGTFISEEDKGGIWHGQILGCTNLAWLSSLWAESQLLQKRTRVAFCSYFSYFLLFFPIFQNQAALLGVKLSALKNCGSQPRAASLTVSSSTPHGQSSARQERLLHPHCLQEWLFWEDSRHTQCLPGFRVLWSKPQGNTWNWDLHSSNSWTIPTACASPLWKGVCPLD